MGVVFQVSSAILIFIAVTLLIILFQCAALAFDVVNEENVYACVGHPLKSDMKTIVNWLLNDDFVAAYKSILYQLTFFLFCI